MKNVFIKKWYLCNKLKNYNYLIVNCLNNNCLVIDPTISSVYIDYIERNGLLIEAILLSHSHYDHISGVEELLNIYKCPIYANFQINNNVMNYVKKDFVLFFNTVPVVSVIYSPGHTNDHLCFYIKSLKALFSGDTIFNAGIGNISDKTGNICDLYNTILKINQLPDDTVIYPAHDYFEKNILFSLSCDSSNKFCIEWLKKINSLPTFKRPNTRLIDERNINIFFQIDTLKRKCSFLNQLSSNSLFSYLRFKRDAFQVG